MTVWCAFKYLFNPKQPENEPTPYVIVTALVDEIQFTRVTPKVREFLFILHNSLGCLVY